MSIESTRRLVEALDLNIREEDVGKPHFRDPDVRPFPLNKDGFRLIQEVDSRRNIAFVDGGNLEIMGAPNFSVQLNRIYAGVWNGREKVVDFVFPQIQFFSAIFSSFKNDEIYYETIIVPEKTEFEKYLPEARDLSFNSNDRSIMNGNHRADIGRVASIARRFAEWKFASQVLQDLREGDVLVMDGTLQTSYPKEEKYLNGLASAAKRQGVVLSGLSKSSFLFTTTGLSLMGAVNKLAEENKVKENWYYPIAESTREDHNVMILAVKLNNSKISERVYRYEIQREAFKSLSELHLNQILTQLTKNSSDATFPGYPYGLIDADRFARVSYGELDSYRGIIVSQISALGMSGKFMRHIRATDAHSVLNALVV